MTEKAAVYRNGLEMRPPSFLLAYGGRCRGAAATRLASMRLLDYTYCMEAEYTWWQDGEFFVGFLNSYPDDSTQGMSLTELEKALLEIYEIKHEEQNHLTQIRKTGRIKVPA